LDDNQDAIELKRRARRRLVGAIALVVLVVIVLPIIFDHEPKSLTQDLTIQIPSQDSGKGAVKAMSPPPVEPSPTVTAAPTVSAPQSVPAPALTTPAPSSAVVVAAPVKEEVRQAGGTESVEAPKADAAKAAKVDAVKQEKKAAEPKTPAKPAKDSSAKAEKPALTASQDEAGSASRSGFYVPLGSFTKQENVRQVQSKVSNAGFKSYAEKNAGSSQTKVRAGPFATREAAENARDKLKSAGMDVGPVGSR
jgi:DedD protein